MLADALFHIGFAAVMITFVVGLGAVSVLFEERNGET